MPAERKSSAAIEEHKQEKTEFQVRREDIRLLQAHNIHIKWSLLRHLDRLVLILVSTV